MTQQIKIDTSKLKRNHEVPMLLLDFIMLGLISINLLWMLFDAFYGTTLFRDLLTGILPEFSQFYGDQIHPNYAIVDLGFVAIYVAEISFRWLHAIYNKTHHRWFFYPFVHWYDVLGCIPSPAFRLLRLLRFYAIIARLQRHGVIDISHTFPYRFIRKYYNVLLEEISDRVVINVIDGIQDEIKHGSPISDQILENVVMPRKAILVEWLTERINLALEATYAPKRLHLEYYIREIVADSISEDPAVNQLHNVPLVGTPVAEAVENMVGNIVFRVFDRLMQDIAHEGSDEIVSDVSDAVIEKFLEPSDKLSAEMRFILIDALEVYKKKLHVQRWKQQEW